MLNVMWKWKLLSCVQIFVDTMDTVQYMEFSRPEYWSLFTSSGDLPNPGIEPVFPALQADSLPAEPPGKPKRPHIIWFHLYEIYSVGESTGTESRFVVP